MVLLHHLQHTNPGWFKSICFKLVSSGFYFWYLMPHHYLWKHLWFWTNWTENTQLILGHFTGNLEETPLVTWKLLRRKQAQWATGVLRKTYKGLCFKQVSAATITTEVTLAICPIFFPSWHSWVCGQLCDKPELEPKCAKKGFLFMWMTCQSSTLWGCRKLRQQRNVPSCNSLA